MIDLIAVLRRIANQGVAETFDQSTDSLEAIANAIAAMGFGPGISLWMFGRCAAAMAPSMTIITTDNLGVVLPNDVFNNEFWMQVIHNASAPGAAPEREIRRITDFVGATQTFTTDAFTANLEPGDLVAIFHESILPVEILGFGTLDTSSDTVPADSTRAAGHVWENDNYFRGCLLMPTEGNCRFQPRRIVQYTNATGVFTIDPNNPFSQATGLVDYVIIGSQAEFVPAGGGSNNRTPSDVIGMKDEVIPAMNVAPGTIMIDTIVHHVKAILERVGATPADPDDSLLTSVGQRDATASLDDLSDVTTTDVEAKLRRILLRMSGAGVFSATIQGAARTELDTMLEQLATYLVAAGAAMALQVNGNVARTNLQQALTDYFAAFGCDGANVFNPTIQGAARTDLDAALYNTATYFSALGAAMALQVNGNPARTNLEQALSDYFAVVGCDGANIFSTTIQGVARTTIEAAFDGLAAYFVAAGGALSVTIDPGGAARTTLATLWNDLGQMLAGAAGITTFPARALPAAGVSLAEVERYIAELKPHFDTPTALTHTTVSAAPTEDTAFTTAAVGPGLLHAIFFLNNLVAGDDITFRVYQFDSVSAAYQLLSEQQFVGVQINKVWTISGLYVDAVAHIQVRTLRTSGTNRSFGSRRSIYQQPVA